MGLNLLKYFTSQDEHLPASYVKKCKKFLEEITKKRQATSGKLQASSSKRLEKDIIKK